MTDFEKRVDLFFVQLNEIAENVLLKLKNPLVIPKSTYLPSTFIIT